MPKSKEQIIKETKEQFRALYEAGDISDMIDLIEDIEEEQLTSNALGQPDKTKSDAMREFFSELFREKDIDKTSTFHVELTKEMAKRKIHYIVQTGAVMEEYEEKIKNKEIPDTEEYSNDPKLVTRIAGIATTGSKAFNKIKQLDFASNTINSCMPVDGWYVNKFYEKSTQVDFDQLNRDEYNKHTELSEETRNKYNKHLDYRSGDEHVYYIDNDKNKTYVTYGYAVDGSPMFSKVPEHINKITTETDEYLENALKYNKEILDRQRNAAADPYVGFSDKVGVIAQRLDLHVQVGMGFRMMARSQEAKDKLKEGVTDKLDELRGLDGKSLQDCTPAEVLALLDKKIEEVGNFAKSQKRLLDNDEELKKKFDDMSTKDENSRAIKNAAIKSRNEIDEKRINDLEVLGCAEATVTTLNRIKDELLEFYTPEVQALKDEPISKHLAEKKAAIKQIEIDSPEAKNIKILEEELQRRKEERELESKTKSDLETELGWGDGDGGYYAAITLSDPYFRENETRIGKAKIKGVEAFMDTLSNTAPSKKTDLGFLTELGKNFKEKEANFKAGFDKKVNEIKKDILAGGVPGVYADSPEMAQDIASDLAYHNTREGKLLKGVHDAQKQVTDALLKNPNWKNYMSNHADFTNGFKAPDMGNAAEKYGYKVSTHFSKTIGGTPFEKMPHAARNALIADKQGLEAMREQSVKSIVNAEMYTDYLKHITTQAEKVLATLNATNKTNHRNSGSYNRMVGALENIVNLKTGKMKDSNGKEVDITHAGVVDALNDLAESSREYQEAHNRLFKGNTKGFGRTRYNSSMFLQSFAEDAKKNLDNSSKMLDRNKPIAEIKSENEKKISIIDKEALGRGLEISVRKNVLSPEQSLDAAIKAAEEQNRGVKGNENYGLALQSAKQLKQAIHDNNAEQIAQLSEQTKIYINNYTSTKYNQWINDDKPNKKGFKRIGVMNALASIVDTAAAYGRNLEGISNDISAQNTYNQSLQDDKQAIADAKAQQQSKLDSDSVNRQNAHNALDHIEVDKVKDANAVAYSDRAHDKGIKGLDKVSATAANEAFSALEGHALYDDMTPEMQKEAKERIAELVLDKMIQLDHGGKLHSKMKNMNEEQFKESAKTLSESPAFKAAVPDTINGFYVKKFLADHDGHGVMEVKNSIDRYQKTVKNINDNANNVRRQPAPDNQANLQMHN